MDILENNVDSPRSFLARALQALELVAVLFETKFIAILPLLSRLLLHVPQPPLVLSLPHILVNIIESRGERSIGDGDADDLLICSLLVLYLSKMIEKDEFEQFTRLYLAHNSDRSIHWSTHLFSWHFYSNCSSSRSDYTYSTQEIPVKISATPTLQSSERTRRFFSNQWQLLIDKSNPSSIEWRIRTGNDSWQKLFNWPIINRRVWRFLCKEIIRSNQKVRVAA